MPTSGMAVCPVTAMVPPRVVASSCNGGSQVALLEALAFTLGFQCPMGN